jgi:hypothetical protein
VCSKKKIKETSLVCVCGGERSVDWTSLCFLLFLTKKKDTLDREEKDESFTGSITIGFKVLAHKKKLFSWFVRVVVVCPFFFYGPSENPIIPAVFLFCFLLFLRWSLEVARVVAKVRLRGLALPSAAASGRCHRWRGL